MFLLWTLLTLTKKGILATNTGWPSGTYGLPKAISGCPQSWNEGWRKQDLEDDRLKKSAFSPAKLHMDVILTDDHITRHFCMKPAGNGDNKQWPTGTYCVYKKSQCPTGMTSGSIHWDDEDDSPNKNDDNGNLPDGSYRSDTTIYYCCQDQGQWNNSIELPVEQPFYLLPYKSTDCQRVKWALSTLESITFDTEDYQNHDRYNGQHVFTNQKQSLPTMYYCYYRGCQHKFQDGSGNFNATNYPDFQYCSWLVTVSKGFVVFINFSTMTVPNCKENYIEVFDGENGTAPLLARYCGSNATSHSKLLSTGNSILLLLKSGDNSKNPVKPVEFYAAYKSLAPTSDVLSFWPSGTYSLPKPASGCPNLWSEGWRKQDMENDAGQQSSFSSAIHMDAVLSNNDITRGFCSKTLRFNKIKKSWPKGHYCIYKKHPCPSGMKEGYIDWDDEDTSNNSSYYGLLPDGEYTSDTMIYYCCQDQGQWYNSIELPVNKPFYLLPYKSTNCQRVKWALSTLESITYNTEDYSNQDAFHGHYVFTDERSSLPTIYYCYYQGCQHQLNGDKGTLSANNFPDFQYCSWTVAVENGLVVLLSFTHVNVPHCDENYIEIYDGVNDTAPFLARYCGRNATSGNTLKGTKNSLFVLLKSGNNSSPRGDLGFHITYEAVTRVQGLPWPTGSYGLPKPKSGCPSMWVQGWRQQDMENDGRLLSSFSSNFHMDAVLTSKYIKRSFCIKPDDYQQNRLWPAGSYCVYKTKNCSHGMKSGSIRWDDEDDSPGENDGDGLLPDGIYNHDTRIYYCCQDQGHWSNSIELPVDQPFYLLPYSSINCQRVKFALSTLESITYDTEDTGNYDEFIGHHVFTDRVKSLPKIFYCYYQGCQHKLKGENGEFSSIGYPDFQYCSWKITVKDGKVVLLNFTHINVPNCNQNNVEVYDGINDTAPLIARYCGSNATSGYTMRGTGSNLFVIFKSGDNSISPVPTLGFHILYKSVAAVSGPSWPSGSYGLPKAVSGCPEMFLEGWRKQDLVNRRRRTSSHSTNFHMDADLTADYIKRRFCLKIMNYRSNRSWPKGSYCIYKKYHCPSSMQEGHILWDDEDQRPNKNGKFGVLPDGEYDDDTKIYYCCQDQGQWYNSIELPVDQPFYLLPYKSTKCQRVKWALSTLESITYNTEDNNNFDEFEGHHVYTDARPSFPKIYYCYYKGCQFKISNNSGEVSSSKDGTQSYPDHQYCSWLLEGDARQILLTFTYLHVPDCSKNYITVYDGENERFPLLSKYCGPNAVSGAQVISSGNHLFIVVKSGDNSDMDSRPGFRAKYNSIQETSTSARATMVTTKPRMIDSPIVTARTATALTTSITPTTIKTATAAATTTATAAATKATTATKTPLLSSTITRTSSKVRIPIVAGKTSPAVTAFTTATAILEQQLIVPTTEWTIKEKEMATTTKQSTEVLSNNPVGPEARSNKDKESIPISLIVVPVLGGIMLVAIISVIMYFRRKREKPNIRRLEVERQNPSYESSFETGVEDIPTRYQNPSGVISRDNNPGVYTCSCRETENPVYEPGTDDDQEPEHVYCTIDDIKSKVEYQVPQSLDSGYQHPRISSPEAKSLYIQTPSYVNTACEPSEYQTPAESSSHQIPGHEAGEYETPGDQVPRRLVEVRTNSGYLQPFFNPANYESAESSQDQYYVPVITATNDSPA